MTRIDRRQIGSSDIAAARASLERSLERPGLERGDILLRHDIDTWAHGDPLGK
jgi:hypothetical protein